MDTNLIAGYKSERQVNEFHAIIMYYAGKKGIHKKGDIEKHMMISHAAFTKYWKEPWKFTLMHMTQICDYLDIPTEERGKLL